MLLEEARAYLDVIRWDFGDVIRRPSSQGSVMLHFRASEDCEKSLDDWRAMADVYGSILGLVATLLVADADDLTITTSSLVEGLEDMDAEQRALQVMRNHKLRLVGAAEFGGTSRTGMLSLVGTGSSVRLRVEDNELGDVLAGFQGHKVLAHWTRGNVVSMLWDCERIMEVVYDAWGPDEYEIGVYEDLGRVSGAVDADWLVVLEEDEAEVEFVVS